MPTAHLHLFAIPPWVNMAFCISIVLLAAMRGWWLEWIVTAAWAFPDFVIPGLIHNAYCPNWCLSGPRPVGVWMLLCCDLAMLGACALAAARADRYWVIWAGSLAFLSVLTDVMGLALPGVISHWALFSADEVWWVLIGVVIAWGVLGARGGSTRPVGPSAPRFRA
jgi:hypothetical protein